jgi:hypothetical protein
MLKQILMGTLVLGSLMAQPVANARQDAQQARIRQGVRSGSLTAPETARLARQSASVQRQIRRDKIDGGGLTVAERARIQKEQNQLSRRIAVQKHDGQTRR